MTQRTAKGLPELCMSRLPADGRPILILRGEAGYYEITPREKGERPMTPEQFNKANGITEAQLSAMRVGSLFGWNVPGADPATWEKRLAAVDCVIEPCSIGTSWKTGALVETTRADVERLLGFPPNVRDDVGKVTCSWAFTVDGEPCAVWDWKGSLKVRQLSTWGPESALRKVFAERYLPIGGASC